MMLVYADAARAAGTREVIVELAGALAGLAAQPPGMARHGALVAAFVDAGALAQGLADADFAAHGLDRRSPAVDAALALLLELARAVETSWRPAGAALPALPDARRLLDLALPACVTLVRPEGFGCYAVYPEAYAAAARASGLGASTRVVGVRSIGTSLAAAVAAALGAAAPVTVRPVGHPFAREVRLDPALGHELTADPAACFAIVDEGPGLSGSSLGAVADALEHLGVAGERIVFFPGHAGDLGPHASAAHRRRWARARRAHVSFDELALGRDPAHVPLGRWAEDLVGAPTGPLVELSGGAWRGHLHADEATWPPVHAAQERRKLRLRTASGSWLLKFAGLGRTGEQALTRARALHAAGFGVATRGLRHGFLVQRWAEGARPLAEVPGERGGFLARVAAYLGFRTRAFAGAPPGATLAELLHMGRENTREALGADAADAWSRWRHAPERLAGRVRVVATDNRLHLWEWLVTRDGRLLKTDATDHCAAHDLVGCQDPAWDLAGAAVELDLAPEELAALHRGVERAGGRAIDAELVAFSTPCYLAFQLGAWTLAAAAGAPGEAARLHARVARYRDALAALLMAPPRPPHARLASEASP